MFSTLLLCICLWNVESVMNVMAVAYSVSLKCDLYTLFVLLCLFNLESIKVAILTSEMFHQFMFRHSYYFWHFSRCYSVSVTTRTVIFWLELLLCLTSPLTNSIELLGDSLSCANNNNIVGYVVDKSNIESIF